MDWSKLLQTVIDRLGLFTYIGASLSAILLFAPDSFIKTLGLLPLTAKWHPWIGVTFLLCSLLAIPQLWQRFQDYRDSRDKHKEQKWAFPRLTGNEKRLLLRLYDSAALRLPYKNPLVISLQQKKMIIQTSPYVENTVDLEYFPELGFGQYDRDLASIFALDPYVRDLIRAAQTTEEQQCESS